MYVYVFVEKGQCCVEGLRTASMWLKEPTKAIEYNHTNTLQNKRMHHFSIKDDSMQSYPCTALKCKQTFKFHILYFLL